VAAGRLACQMSGTMRLTFGLAFLVLLGGCARTIQRPPQVHVATVPSVAPATAARPGDATPAIAEVPELRHHFEAERATGSIALYDSGTGRVVCSDARACGHAVIPASTFKIPNALIALELGVVEDAETLLPWDGQVRAVDEWNRDHTLRTGLRVSCVPCFQRIARDIGAQRMQQWIDRFAYGNRELSGGIDRFWLNGGLRISPLEQIEFLRRLEGGKLGVSARSLEILLDVLALDVGQNHVLRGKTGLSRPPESATLAGWFVGWVEIGTRRVFFATLIDGVGPDVDVVPLRRSLTERILRAHSALPA
jgi:beta-lactamase class D